MKIGELSKATGTPIETIRFYERERLLPEATRTAGNYRIYGASHEARLSFIRRCRSLDMALDEIRTLLRFKDAPTENCGEVNALLDDHVGHVASRIRELKDLEKQLRLLREQCQEAQGVVDCGILKELSCATKPAKERSPRRHVHGTHR
jgi:Cd(II)/Pb(II)-responsive transcriptional regulator